MAHNAQGKFSRNALSKQNNNIVSILKDNFPDLFISREQKDVIH
jgi:hypothetical protein